mmetsp:Transcript_6523/g.11566  ORF Transcript_6523/g.11566 Transcript_6523/m.11566 type:complete len:208 (-) Transcript_6523:203-826(-)
MDLAHRNGCGAIEVDHFEEVPGSVAGGEEGVPYHDLDAAACVDDLLWCFGLAAIASAAAGFRIAVAITAATAAATIFIFLTNDKPFTIILHIRRHGQPPAKFALVQFVIAPQSLEQIELPFVDALSCHRFQKVIDLLDGNGSGTIEIDLGEELVGGEGAGEVGGPDGALFGATDVDDLFGEGAAMRRGGLRWRLGLASSFVSGEREE